MTDPCVRYVVLGGGISGVSCAKTLRTLAPGTLTSVTLVSPSSIVKSVTNLNHITQNLAEFQVQATPIDDFSAAFPGVDVKCCSATMIDPEKHVVLTSDGSEVEYTKLCVCTGARPSLISEGNPHVIGIRNTQTVQELEARLCHAKKIVVVGNGGIAMELVYGLRNIEVVWVIKDSSIGTTFLDAGASQFLVPNIGTDKKTDSEPLKPDPRRSKYTVFNLANNSSSHTEVAGGSALGPDWHEQAALTGDGKTSRVSIEYQCEVSDIKYRGEDFEKDTQHWPVVVSLSNGKVIECNFVVSATGVTPNSEIYNGVPGCKIAEDGGVVVDNNMRVAGLGDVYAAGDVCKSSWNESPHWLQMRLWTQARQMGIFVAHCMVSHEETHKDLPLDFCFEMFAHVTRFFGHKVVLLGLFNAQGLNPGEVEFVVRVIPGKEYIKVVLKNGRMFGAVLIGETDLEETFENLILNGMDLSHYGDNLLHPSVGLEDYFD